MFFDQCFNYAGDVRRIQVLSVTLDDGSELLIIPNQSTRFNGIGGLAILSKLGQDLCLTALAFPLLELLVEIGLSKLLGEAFDLRAFIKRFDLPQSLHGVLSKLGLTSVKCWSFDNHHNMKMAEHAAVHKLNDLLDCEEKILQKRTPGFKYGRYKWNGDLILWQEPGGRLEKPNEAQTDYLRSAIREKSQRMFVFVDEKMPGRDNNAVQLPFWKAHAADDLRTPHCALMPPMGKPVDDPPVGIPVP